MASVTAGRLTVNGIIDLLISPDFIKLPTKNITEAIDRFLKDSPQRNRALQQYFIAERNYILSGQEIFSTDLPYYGFRKNLASGTAMYKIMERIKQLHNEIMLVVEIKNKGTKTLEKINKTIMLYDGLVKIVNNIYNNIDISKHVLILDKDKKLAKKDIEDQNRKKDEFTKTTEKNKAAQLNRRKQVARQLQEKLLWQHEQGQRSERAFSVTSTASVTVSSVSTAEIRKLRNEYLKYDETKDLFQLLDKKVDKLLEYRGHINFIALAESIKSSGKAYDGGMPMATDHCKLIKFLRSEANIYRQAADANHPIKSRSLLYEIERRVVEIEDHLIKLWKRGNTRTPVIRKYLEVHDGLCEVVEAVKGRGINPTMIGSKGQQVLPLTLNRADFKAQRADSIKKVEEGKKPQARAGVLRKAGHQKSGVSRRAGQVAKYMPNSAAARVLDRQLEYYKTRASNSPHVEMIEEQRPPLRHP